MDISSLEAFLAVAEQQSFSRASQQLHLTQPAVSKRVANLEAELDTQLFNRVARRVSLTVAGRQLLPRARDLVQQARDLQTYAGSLSAEVSGTLHIAISHHIGLHRMPPVLREFNQRYPQVLLDIRFADSDLACAAVEQGEIEFAVITLPSEASENLQMQTVWPDPLSIVVGAGHALAEHPSKKLPSVTLAEYPAVLPSDDTETAQIIRRLFDQQNLTLKVQMQTNNLETLKMLSVAGLGWSLLPTGMLDDSLLSLDIGTKLQRRLGLVFHRQRSLSNAANALRELIEQSSAETSTE
ncbi:MAG: LysR family transcriptional regulator [Gammaproteobacteria bacterium]|nr:LysR family transcriptional regulator [Gammaproteobacteria bacterium]